MDQNFPIFSRVIIIAILASCFTVAWPLADGCNGDGDKGCPDTPKWQPIPDVEHDSHAQSLGSFAVDTYNENNGYKKKNCTCPPGSDSCGGKTKGKKKKKDPELQFEKVFEGYTHGQGKNTIEFRLLLMALELDNNFTRHHRPYGDGDHPKGSKWDARVIEKRNKDGTKSKRVKSFKSYKH